MRDSTDFDRGDVALLDVEFKDKDANYSDPTTVRLKTRDPSGTITTYTYPTDIEIVKTSTGIYYAQITLDESGKWHYRWEGSGGAGAGVAAGEIYVKKDVFV